MKLSFFGGARALTGSCFLLEVGQQNILIDCGLQQGCDEFNDNALEFYASRIDQVLVTNAHIDSCGRLPLLVQEGYYGRIITTVMSKKLMRILLKDVADMRMNEAWWRNQKGQRSGMAPHDTLFSMTDVVSTMQQVETEEYDQIFDLCQGVQVRFSPSGHMPGGAIIELWATEGEETRKFVFTGDMGNKHYHFSGPVSEIKEADFIVMESACALSKELVLPETLLLEEFSEVLDRTMAHAGNVIIPVNAVGRVQEVLMALAEVKKRNAVKSVPRFKVYLDSFLAEEIVRIFQGDTRTDLGTLSVADIQGENNPFLFEDLVLCTTEADSARLNLDQTPKVILAGSGMCDRGRVQHHLKHNLWRSECAVLMVGHLGEGSFGKRLLEGVRSVQLFGEEVVVRAKILDFSGTSGHPDRIQLEKWLGHFEKKPRHIFVVQGSEAVCQDFAAHLETMEYSVHAPMVREEYDIFSETVVHKGISQEERALSKRGQYYSLPFIRLQDAIRELDVLVKEGHARTGEEFETMAEGVRELIARWTEETK